MPKYKYTLTNGKTLTLEGDTQPSDEEVESIAQAQGVQLQPVTTPAPITPTPEEIPTVPIEEPPIPEEVPPIEPKPEPGFLSRAWSAISEPITDLPSRFASQVAEYVDPRQGEAWTIPESVPLVGGMAPRGFVAGAMQGLGDIASSLTSPINLATAALTGGTSTAARAGLPQVARAMQMGAKATALPVIAHGGMEVLNPESTMGERGMGLAEIAGGIMGMKGPSLEAGPITPKVPAKVTEPVVAPKSVTPATSQSLKPGTVVVIKANKATPANVKKARESGFEFEGINDQGDFRFKKTGEPSQQPILETEVGETRPTRGALGPKTDIKKESAVAEAVNFPRAVMASVDMSAPLRQGLPLIHKKQFWTSLDDMFKAWGSEDAYKAIQQSIADKPLFKPRVGPNNKVLPSFAEEAGLKLTDLADFSKREEMLMSTWAEKIPGVRRSNRAYTAFLNKLRADTFEDLVSKGKVFGADAEVNVPLARELANFVNTASGRGSLGKLEQSAVTLNSMFFSPRLIASRLQMLNPNYYIMADPMVRKEALKSLLAVAGVGNTLGQLARMSGVGTVESDPASSDFGKIKIGNTRIDPFGGFQQYIVAAQRMMPNLAKIGLPEIGGRMKSTVTGKEYQLGEGGFGRSTRLDILGRFTESKLNPVFTFATGILRGKDFTGAPFNIPDEVASRFTPIFVQDLVTLLSEEPTLIGGIQKIAGGEVHPENLPLAVPPFFGMGAQTYESR